MLNFPKTTEFNRLIPKQKFYDNINVSSELKKVFVEQIKNIYWKNKIATSTTNLAPGNSVTELEVLEIRLNGPLLDESLLKQIDKEIPYHILFLLSYKEKYQAWIGYKENNDSGKNAFKVNGYYHTEWMSEDELPIKLEGLNIDDVYENLVRQIAGTRLDSNLNDDSLKVAVERDNQRQQLKKQIEKLEAKIRKEKQLNKQMLLNNDLKKLKKQLSDV
ncbi:DUF4391 domain-containing protein [Enterococcus cecorum]|uniref:DUF4391 domain-containing protein n=1 Tax=Enterococcus cecorum TaxID=44008 RepID=UPI000A70D04B|nr:DUF4391 domain-containing protein [Enterococcus cecorum]CAI3416201.1 hypothetical protein CIRMBP1307_01084 [Enterococcus cecorum]CAI3444318.1 hypothetical protein CIRMBP1308_01265 [Enterococcus cecorum]